MILLGANVRSLAIGISMLVAASLSYSMKPSVKIADLHPSINLDQMIPKKFGDWSIDPSITPITVSPDVQAQLDKIYNQTLARTYVNAAGDRIMLSIAYGGDQGGENTQLHRPEFCYVSQGFQLARDVAATLVTQYGTLPVRRLLATKGSRSEPITYWIVVGDQPTLPGFGRKVAQLKYGLTGRVPDGMLVRVSSISSDESAAFNHQHRFINDMLAGLQESARVRLTGVSGS